MYISEGTGVLSDLGGQGVWSTLSLIRRCIGSIWPIPEKCIRGLMVVRVGAIKVKGEALFAVIGR